MPRSDNPIQLDEALRPWVELMHRFIAGEMTFDEFQTAYFEMFRSFDDNLPIDPDAVQDINSLFLSVDNTVEPPEVPRPEFTEITVEQLKDELRAFLERVF